MKLSNIYYTLMTTELGKIGVVWRNENYHIRIIEIILPPLSINSIKKNYPGVLKKKNIIVEKVLKCINSYGKGKKVRFSLKNLDLECLNNFQKKVLMRTRMIPPGKTKSYGTIAKELGIPKGGARAVGQALAKNPFPIIIPCHRVIKSDGTLGGFGGNVNLKRKLLTIERTMVEK